MKTFQIVIITLTLFSLTGCKKDFLDVKPSTSIVEPVTVENLTGLLDNPINDGTPALPVLSSDEYSYIDYTTYQSAQTATERNAYIWAKDIFAGEPNIKDWAEPYTTIFYANNVLSALNKIQITSDNSNDLRFLEGWALFLRSYQFYNLVNNFCKAYDPVTAGNDLGIPLRLKPEIDVIEPRSTVAKTYAVILSDLNKAKGLLSNRLQPDEKKNRPSLPAVHALLARIYLNIGDFGNAEKSADSCLNLYSKLIDYRIIPFPNSNGFGANAFGANNIETLYSSNSVVAYAASLNRVNNTTYINDELLSKYKQGDARRRLYFTTLDGRVIMAGNYRGTSLFSFTGLANDEIYLIKSECLARRNDVGGSMDYLNRLLEMRIDKGQYIPLVAQNKSEALELVLQERDKELVWRGLRWFDLKRLNKEGRGITLTRLLNGVTYSLPPNDPRYVFPIPDDEIANSNIAQNPR